MEISLGQESGGGVVHDAEAGQVAVAPVGGPAVLVETDLAAQVSG